MNDERRYNAGRPYIRPHHPVREEKKRSAESDYLWAQAMTFFVGSLLGAVIVIGAITSGLVSL